MTPPAPIDRRGGNVERRNVEPMRRERFGVIAESAAHSQRAPAFALRVVFVQPACEMRVGRQFGPRDAFGVPLGLGVERFEPAFGVASFEKGLCKLSCARPARVRR